MKYTNIKQGIYRAGNTLYIVLNDGVENLNGPINASPHFFEGEECVLESNNLKILRNTLERLIKSDKSKKETTPSQCLPKFTPTQFIKDYDNISKKIS